MKLTTIASSVTQMFKRAAPASAPAPGTQAGLYNEEATDQLVKFLTRLPEIDVVLKQAGIKREKLSILLGDDEIHQACETRLDAVLATPWRVEPSEDDEGKRLHELLKPFISDCVSGAFKARLYGYSVMEAVYKQEPDGKVGLKFVGEKPMEWFEPKSDGRLMYYANDGSSGPYGDEVDQQFKFFLTRARPTYANPYGEAMLSRLYWPFFFRNNGWKFWGKFLERFGSPLLVGKSSDPTKMVAALLAAHSNAVIGVGTADTVESVGVAAGNTGQAFDGFESAVIRRIQKVVLGQTLTSGTDGGSGNRALGQVHDAVRKDKRDSDIAMVNATVQRIADALCALNNWKPHQVVFADEKGLETARAERDGKLHAMGVRFTPEYLQDNYSLRDEDFEMSSDAPAEGTPLDASSGSTAKVPGGAKAPASAGGKKSAGAKAAISHIAFSQGRFTAKQQEVEDQGDAGLEAAGQPLSNEALRSAILAAEGPEDLAIRLFTLVGDVVSEEQFQETLERALFAADVLGYVHADK